MSVIYDYIDILMNSTNMSKNMDEKILVVLIITITHTWRNAVINLIYIIYFLCSQSHKFYIDENKKQK